MVFIIGGNILHSFIARTILQVYNPLQVSEVEVQQTVTGIKKKHFLFSKLTSKAYKSKTYRVYVCNDIK